MRGDEVSSKPVFKRRRLCLNNIGASLLPIVAKLSEAEQHFVRPVAGQPAEATTKSGIEIPKSLRRDIERSKETLAKKQNSFAPFIEVEQLQQGTDPQAKEAGDGEEICGSKTSLKHNLTPVSAPFAERIVKAMLSRDDLESSPLEKKICVENEQTDRTRSREIDEPASNLPKILTTRIMIVHSNQQLVAEISSHLLLQLAGSAVVFAPDLNFASKLMMQQDFDLIVLGAGMAGDKCDDFRKALKGAKSSLILITLGPSKTRNSAALNLLGYRAIKALELAGKPCRTPATVRCAGPIAMPFQHLKQDLGNELVSSSCFSRLSMAVGLASKGQNLSKTVRATLLALSNNPSNLESH